MDTEKKSILEQKRDGVILRQMMHFNRGLHLLMGVALIVTSVMVIGLFGNVRTCGGKFAGLYVTG